MSLGVFFFSFFNIKVCCCCSVVKLCLTLCNPMNCSTPGPPVHHQLPEFSTGLIDYKLLCIKQISNKDILYSKGNYSHYLVITFNRV